MINFTGQTKKRIVNLGDRKPERNSRNYLEYTRLLRQQREEQRLKERSAVVLQKYFRKRIDLYQASASIESEWRDDYMNWKNTEDWEKWLLEANFILKWLATRHNPNESKINLELLKHALGKNNEYSILQRRIVSFVGCLSKYIIIIEKHPDMVFLANITVDIFNLFIDKYQLSSSNCFSRVNESLSKIIVLNSNNLQRSKIQDFIFKINVHDSYNSFVKFLSIPKIFEKNIQHLELIRKTIREQNIGELDELQKVNLLINFLTIHGDEDFVLQDYLVIQVILSNITFSIVSIDADSEDDDIVMESDDIIVKSKDLVMVEKSLLSELEVLCSSKFLRGVTDLLKEDHNENISRSVHIIFSTLIHLLPTLKNKICVLLTVTPGLYKLIYNRLKDSEIYKNFIDISVQQDYLTPQDFYQLQSFTNGYTLLSFWKTLYTFEELYSYWLIVSNDFEIFSDEKLNEAEAIEFLQFLKCLCLSLLFNNAKYFYEEYDKLKEISLSLLNQLYMRNLRLKFLPNSFWKPKALDFNIDGMLSIIANEEERRLENELQYSDDESNELKSKVQILSIEAQARLDILKKLPFFISFRERVKVFQSLIELDRQRLYPHDHFFNYQSKLKADIRRDHLLEDAYVNFHKSGSGFKNPLQVVFFNEYGKEAGIDGGGITKEFLTSVVTEGFSSELFKETEDNQIYPNSDIYLNLSKRIDLPIQQERLTYLRFLGNVVGKCFYENVLIDISFAPFFLNKWCNDSMKNSINDLNYLDKELYVNLMKLTIMNSEDLESLDLTFNVDEKINGKNYNFDLIPNGSSIKVDTSNRLNYIHQLSNFKLNQSLHIQTKYFLSGLYEIISSTWLSMFDSHELQMLISGGTSDVNINDWKENVEYHGFFDDDLTVVYFWEVVSEMAAEERFKLIKFVTSVSRAPLLGFGSLAPKFGIRNSGGDHDRLPTASTCVNLLKLPDYRDKELVRSKLLYAISMGAGFDLS